MHTVASASESTAFGRGTVASVPGMMAVGSYNIPLAQTNFESATHPRFVVGVGLHSGATRNGFSVFRNGRVLIGNGTEASARLHVMDSSVLFTGPPLDVPAGQIDPPVSGPGRIMMWFAPMGAFRAGGVSGGSWSRDNVGELSAAFGLDNIAAASNTMSWGRQNITYASQATAFGQETGAYGLNATAFGYRTIANGSMSLAAGEGTTTRSILEFVIGRYNTIYNPTGSGGVWHPNDRLFTIGNGASVDSRSDALVLLKNGRMGIGASSPSYRLTIFDNNLGIDRPAENTMAFYTNGAERLRLTGNGRVGIGLTNPGAPLEVSNENAMIRITNPTGGTTGIEFLRSGGGDDWRLHNTGGLITLSRSTNDLGSVTDHYVFTQSAFRPAVDNTQTVGQGNFRWVSVHATNGTIQTSDARLKENIQPLDYGLHTVAQLRPVSYRWKDHPAGDAHLGFLAQEVQALIPEAVQDA
ncbi:MAG TPA: tail fiber domain-containing protein, partial [Phnomibacter sp.]|nr:tail fiber domain-containing protein [Phnomibacter sp.]